MKVLVLGAGVVGSSTAYHLARDGHQVTVIDRQPAPGLETSFANGGQISVSHATPWATPQTPAKALKWLGRDDAPLIFRWFRWDPALWAWGLRFLANCAPQACAKNTHHTVALALYSRSVLQQLREDLQLDYDALSKGILHIFRNSKDFDHQCRSAEIMTTSGLRQDILSPTQIVALEPALSDAAPTLVGGLYSPLDESGDVHKFTQSIARHAKDLGAEFHQNTNVCCFEQEKGRISAVFCQRQHPDGHSETIRYQADAYVLSLGSFSPLLIRSLGLKLRIYPAKGYSMTLPLLGNGSGAPVISITDDEHKMVYSRLGERLRGAGTAELGGWDQTLRLKRAEQIRRNAQRLFPRAGDYETATLWCGLRPKTPDSLPYICATPLGNLFLNTGHGTLGWTMAAGSGALMADIVGNKTPAVDLSACGLR